MKIPIYQVDAFTDRLFKGNPAAVCPLDNWLDSEVMQNIAQENNLSETVFFVKAGHKYEIRWFTPKLEIDLAGHPTLAAAHVIFNHLGYDRDRIIFDSNSGELYVSKEKDIIWLDFPGAEISKVSPPEELIEGLGAVPGEVFKSRDYLALFDNERNILSLRPDFTILSRLNCLGIIATARGEKSDFVSRFFAPAAGINEDPVTGSAHTTLIPFWAKKLKKNNLHAFQISKRRGEIFCQYHEPRVHIGGQAITFLIGEIFC